MKMKSLQALARIFQSPNELSAERRVRARGLHGPNASPCRPGPLTRRLGCEISKLGEMPFGNSGSFVPKGQGENSPAFQRRDQSGVAKSPEGTTEIINLKNRIQPSLRDSKPPAPFPALKRRAAIFGSPSGTISLSGIQNFRKAVRLGSHRQ